MNDKINPTASQPVFKKCVRCGYSLRGLPGNHACPECGLRFDERCELYRVTNPKQVLFVWIAIFSGGWVVLKNLPHVPNFAAASAWEKVGAVAAVAWFFFVGFGVWFLVKRYRRGFEVAVTSDGLIVRLPGFDDELILWDNIGSASFKQIPEGKPQIAEVFFKDKQKNVSIGGIANIFPTPAHVERFVEQVKARIRTAEGDDASTNRPGSHLDG
jgi:predicted RNA-binding Zn-ribbon protein involved in translation (DUF1610 family)